MDLPAGLVDFHQHAMPMPILHWLAERGLARLDGVNEGYVQLDPVVSGVPAEARLPLPRSHYDTALRLTELDGMGLDAACVSLPPFLIAASHRDHDFVVELVSVGNRALVEWCGADPNRLIPNPSVPVGLPMYNASTWEALGLDNCVGVAIGTWGLGRELDDDCHEPLWEMLASTRRFAFLHPSRASSPERHGDYWLTQLVGYPAETALAVSRLVLGGALERHDFALVLAHAGGCLPSLAGRLDLGWRRKAQTRTVEREPSSYLRRLYYDSAAFSAETLAHVAASIGEGHMVAGSDWPFDLADDDPAGSLRAAGGEALLAQANHNAKLLLRGERSSSGGGSADV